MIKYYVKGWLKNLRRYTIKSNLSLTEARAKRDKLKLRGVNAKIFKQKK